MGKLGDTMLGFKSIMQSDRPVFTDKDGKGIQPMVAFDLSGLAKPVKKFLSYTGFLSALANTAGHKEYNVFGGIGNKFHPRISFGYREEKGSTPKPPARGSAHPGYAFGDYLSELFGNEQNYACA